MFSLTGLNTSLLYGRVAGGICTCSCVVYHLIIGFECKVVQTTTTHAEFTTHLNAMIQLNHMLCLDACLV